MRLSSAPILPWTGGAFSLQVALADGSAAGGEPFLVLSDDQEFARVLIGAIKGDSDTVVDLCAIKLVRNAYRTATFHREGSGWTNPAIENLWSVESERLRELEPAGGFVPRLIRSGPSNQSPTLLPPLFFCRFGQQFFQPPCPKCGTPLTTCRDDALLAQALLPTFGASLERFLDCASCRAAGSEPSFYAFEVSPELAGKPVLAAADLERDLGEALAGGGEEGDRIRAAFPCADCVRAGEQFRDAIASGSRPGPFWTDRWVPLTFFGGPFLVTGLDLFDLDEFSDLLGGCAPEAVSSGKSPGAALVVSGRVKHLPPLSDSRGAGRWFFESHGDGLDALEVFSVKLSAFRQVVHSVLEYSRALGRPHLDLHPRHLLFDIGRVGEGLPAFWNFQLRLHGISTAARLERLASAADVVIPPSNPAVPYAPPEVLEFHLNPPRPAQLILADVEPEARRSGKAFRLHGRLFDPYGIFPSPGPHDWILLTLDNSAVGVSEMAIACRRDPRKPDESQELTFISEPVEMADDVSQRLKRAIGARLPGARYKVYPVFGTPSDLYSLGAVLLRLLLGNDRQDARGIAQAVDRVAKRLESTTEGALGNLDSPGGARALLDQDAETTLAFKKANVFHQELDRRKERPNGIPDLLWNRALLLALRMRTRVQGFSFCSTPGDYDEAHPLAKVEAVLQEVGLIEKEVRSLLFHRQPIHLEIQQVLSEIAEEDTPPDRPGAR